MRINSVIRNTAAAFLAAMLLFPALPATAGDAATILSELPRVWAGTFIWNGSDEVQTLDVVLDEPYMGEDEQIFAAGSASYGFVGLEDVTEVAVEWRITPETSAIEILDLPGKNVDPADFVTDGSYAGKLSNDLMTVKAIWTTETTGEQGVLILEVVPF